MRNVLYVKLDALRFNMNYMVYNVGTLFRKISGMFYKTDYIFTLYYTLEKYEELPSRRKLFAGGLQHNVPQTLFSYVIAWCLPDAIRIRSVNTLVWGRKYLEKQLI